MSTPEDLALMRRALDLARQGISLSSPNPCVGAVVLDRDGNTIGEGTYTYDGLRHAEVLALEQAGSNARGTDSMSIMWWTSSGPRRSWRGSAARGCCIRR